MIKYKKIALYTLGFAIIGLTVVYLRDPAHFSMWPFFSYSAKQTPQQVTTRCPNTIKAKFFDDDWEMIFDYSICNTFERDLKETKVYYVLKFSPVGEDSLIGQGKKIFDSVKNISNPPFSKEIPLRVEGKIVCDSIFAKTFEKNTLGEEIRGKLMIPLTNRYVYEGVFTGSGKNCNGLIKLSRINPKELRPQYQKLYQ